MAVKQINGFKADMEYGEGEFTPPEFLKKEQPFLLMDIYGDFIEAIKEEYVKAAAGQFQIFMAKRPHDDDQPFEHCYQRYEVAMKEVGHFLEDYPSIKEECRKIFEAMFPSAPRKGLIVTSNLSKLIN